MAMVLVLSALVGCRATGGPSPAPRDDAEANAPANGAAGDVGGEAASDGSSSDGTSSPAASGVAPAGVPAPLRVGADAPAGATANEADGPAVHGTLATRYRGRVSGGQQDHDLTQVVSVDVGDARSADVTYHVSGLVDADLDGRPSDGADLFAGIDDTTDQRVRSSLQHAYAEWHAIDGLESLRLGRQRDYLTPEFAWFDGARLVTREAGDARWQGGAYGGVPVQPHEPSSRGDRIVGAFVQQRPWSSARLRLDWMHVEDERLGRDHENDLVELGLWQHLGERVRLEGHASRLDGEPREVRFGGSYVDPQGELVVDLSYVELQRAQVELAVPFDPFFATLQELFPYRQARASVSKGLPLGVDLSGGYDVRRVDDEGDVGDFNRDFEHGFVTLALSELLPDELLLSLTGERWNSQGNDIDTWGADLSRPFGEQSRASVGSYFSLFKYDLFSDSERERVRTLYVALRTVLDGGAVLSARYEFEHQTERDFHALRTAITWRY